MYVAARLQRISGGGRGTQGAPCGGPARRPLAAAAACLQSSSLTSSLSSNNKRVEEQLGAGRTVNKVAGVQSPCILRIYQP